MQNDLTTGSVFRNVLSFSLPYLLSYFLQTLYGMADLFIIGQFEGVASTTAVSTDCWWSPTSIPWIRSRPRRCSPRFPPFAWVRVRLRPTPKPAPSTVWTIRS